MNEKQFLNKYIPLMGKKVNDNLFNTAKLTKTAIINKLSELYLTPVLKTAYSNNDYDKIIAVLEKLVNISLSLGVKPSKEWLNSDLLTHSLGNSKIGKDTLCISVNTGLLCYMSLLGNCSNCNICYAKNSNKMYTNEFIKNTLCQITVLKLLNNEITLHNVLKNTIYSIFCSYSTNEVKNIKFLRFNVNGDILNNEMLETVNKIAKVLIDVFNLYSAYSYTHNKSLDLSIASDIVFNCSDFKKAGFKSCMTKTKFDISMILNDDVILCNGDCNNCSYCKNKNEVRTVIFLKHGGIFEGVHQINDYLRCYLDNQKELDYLLFMRDIAGYNLQ